jgi:hypothetical protein
MSPYSLTEQWHAVRVRAGVPTLRFDEKAAALTQLGTAVVGTLPSAVAVNPAEPDRAER